MVRPGLDVVGVRAVRTPTTGRGERGAVTAETAMVLPLVVAAALGLVWMLALAVTQVRVTDAAREVARALAREEPRAAAVALGRRVAPEDARFDVRDDGSLVSVDVTAEVSGPRGLFGFLPGITVDATAVAAQEPR